MLTGTCVLTARTHILMVANRSDRIGFSAVWVDGRSGSQAKTKTKQAMQLKLAGHDYGI